MSDDKAIQELQVKVAFLEDSLSKVSDEHYQQQRDLQSLKKQFEALLEKLNLMSSSASQEAEISDEKPPHY